MALTGGCQCGAVRFRAAHLGRASLCHCRMCQKAFGNYFAPLVGVEGLVWTKGAPALFRSSTQARRGFCRDCGTPLTFETASGIDLAIGAFDTPKNPGQAIYEFAKANGYTGQKAAPEQKAAPDLSAVARGQEAARGRGGLPSAGGELTVEALAKMSFKEIAKIPAEKLDRIMGAR